MACVYSIDGGNTYISEKDFKDYLKNNLEDLVSSKEIDFSKFSGVIPKESVKVITQPTNESELATMLEKRFGRNPELARAEAKLFDLRASVWSDLTGNPKEDFYSRVSYGDEKSADGLNQIIGEQGASRLENAEMVLADLNVAREMEKAGKTPKEIHLATSWERGSDGKWRFEVPDAEFKGKLGSVENLRTYPFGLNKTFELGDIVDSELLKAYPELKKMDVVFVTDVSYNGVFESYQDSKKNRIKIAIKKNNWQSILLHEIQHAVQNIEGFKDVRSKKNITESQRFKLIEYSQRYKELYNKLIEGNATKSEIEEIEDIEYDWKKDSEVEARNVQTRMNMTPAERKLKMLSETEDVAREHQIIIQNALQQKSGEGLNQVEAYHGSPHSFDKFTTEKIGTGEGAQAFGWGLYFTDLESIAKNYAETLGGRANIYAQLRDAIANDDDITFYSNSGEKIKIYKDKYGDYIIYEQSGSRETDLNTGLSEDEIVEEFLIQVDNRYSTKGEFYVNNKDVTPSKILYKVSLHEGKTPDQYTWLEWDKPLTEEQKDKILKSKVITERLNDFFDYSELPNEENLSEFTDVRDFYTTLTKKGISPKDLSLALLEVGIDGIKYPAESISRGATSDTARGFNYVVFDENAVTIKEKELFQKQQGKAQGQIKFADKVNNFNKAVISLFKTAKADTFIHEFSHLNFQDMLAMAKDNEQVKADVRTAIEFYNQHAKPSERIKNVDEAVEHLLSIDPTEHKGDDTYVKVHEAFANGFSEYLRNENSSIPQALKEVYEVLKQHLKQIAQYIAGAEAKLTPEMEAVYRRLFEPEFVNNLKETASNRQVEREEIERSKPVVKYSEEDIKDAFGNLDVLEQSDRPTPNQIFKSKIAEWKAQKRTDSTFVMEQLNKLVDDLAEGKNKEILKDFLKTKEQEYKELADGGKDLHQRTRTLLENKGLSLEDKERIYKDDNYALVSFIDLQKDVDSAIRQMTYNEVVANEALLKDKLAETTNPKEYVYAETLFNISKVKKGFDYLDELRRSPKKNAKEIERLNERLHKELFALREQGTDAARMLALQKAMDIFTPEVLVENIARERRAARTAEQQQRLKEEVAILKEKIEKGVADTEIHEAIVAELEKTIDDYKADLTELEKQNKQLEDKVKKAEERAKQSKIDSLKERALGKARNSKDLNIDKKAVEQKKSELKGKIIALLNSNLYSQENPDSPIGVLRSYIENHILEQQSSIAKKVSLKDVLDHFKSEGLPVPTEAVVRAYKEARVNLVNEGVNVKAFDLDADIDLTLEAIEAKAEMERLNEQKKALEKKIKDDEKLSKDIEEKRIAQESKRKEKVERDAKVVSNIISNIEQGLQVPQVSKPKLPQTEFNKIKNYVKTKFGQNLTDDQLDIFLNSNDSSGRNMRDVILDMMQEEKFLNSRDFTNPKIVDKAIATSLKGVRWKDRVVKYDRDAAIKEAVDKVLADNPDLTPEEIANVENRIKQLFKEKEIEWTNAQVKKAERKGQPKKPRDISNNIVKLSNLIATGNFNEEANDLLANELGLGGIDEGQRIKIGDFIDVIQSLPKGKLRNLQIESLSAYIASITNPFMFHHNVWSSTIYTEALANPASSLQNATGLMSTLDKVFTDFLLSGDATYLKNFFNAFTKGGFKSSLSMGLFSSNEHFDLAQSEGGFSPFRGIEYAEKYGGELDSSRRRALTKWRGLKTKYTGAKLIGRINEGIDAISQFALGENAAYKHVKAKVEKEFPNLTKEQQFEKIKELLYPMTWTEAKRQAIEQIYKTKGYYKNEFPTAAEINAIAFDIMQQARDEDTKAIMARDAQKGTFRNKPSSWVNGGGLMEGISAAYEASYTWAKNQITNAKFSQKRKNALMSTLNVSKILTVMFSRTPANIIEVGSHYGLLGGAFKLASLQSYKKGLKSAKDISLEAEIEYVNQYQKDVAVRMVKGATLLMLMPVIFAMLNEDKDDDELKDGVYGDSKLNPTGIRNSLVIGGKVIPLNFLGGLAPLFAIQGAITDAEREKTEKNISEESIEGDFNNINHITDLTKRWMMSTIKSTPFYGASKQKDMISDFIDGSTEGIGKLIGGQLAFSYLPSPRMINDVSSWKYTKLPQPHGFVQGLMANTYTPALLITNTAKPMFDYRGREVDIRDRRFMSVGGLFKRLASTPNDNVDNILLNHKIVLPFLNPEKYVINGELLSDRPDDLYVFSKDIAEKYNDMLTNDGEPHQYYITNENGKRELQVVHGLKDILKEIDVYKNSSMDELSKLGSVDINADKQLKKQILRNYNIIVKYVMERNGVEDNTYSRYEKEVLTENERQNLFKNKKSLENKLKKR